MAGVRKLGTREVAEKMRQEHVKEKEKEKEKDKDKDKEKKKSSFWGKKKEEKEKGKKGTTLTQVEIIGDVCLFFFFLFPLPFVPYIFLPFLLPPSSPFRLEIN